MSVHNNFICSELSLDTESMSELTVKTGELTVQMADFFVAKIQTHIPDSMFIHVGT